MSTSPQGHSSVRRALFAVSAAAAALTVGVACSAQSDASTPVQQGGVTKPLSGSDVYLMSCARCHGSDRMGKTDAPKLDTVRMSSLGEQPLKLLIQYGKGRMPAFGGLTQEKVDALVEFLRTS
jgi:mono/diheme cytochrome c family protein